jgi:hypothetical protein
MNGTEKQIEWALKIKDVLLNGSSCNVGIVSTHKVIDGINDYEQKKKEEIDRLIAKQESKGFSESRAEMIVLCEKQLAEIIKIKCEIESCEDANWFIDNKNLEAIMRKRVYSID